MDTACVVTLPRENCAILREKNICECRISRYATQDVVGYGAILEAEITLTKYWDVMISHYHTKLGHAGHLQCYFINVANR